MCAAPHCLCDKQVSLPMLAPLLLGTGMMLRSIRSNASIIFPRLCVMVVLLWMLWFANSVVQNTVFYLRRQVMAARLLTRRRECLHLAGSMHRHSSLPDWLAIYRARLIHGSLGRLLLPLSAVRFWLRSSLCCP